MNKYFTCVFLMLILGCSPGDFSDCLFSSGAEVAEEINLPSFSKVVVGRNISLLIEPFSSSEMSVLAQKDYLDNFRWRIEDNETLHLEATSMCSAGFTEAPVQITLYTPNLTEIVNGTQFLIASKKPLTFPVVTLIADQNHNSASLSMGLFDLEFDNKEVFYRSSNILKSKFSGKTDTFGILKTGGVGEIDAIAFEAKTVNVFHRGFNDIAVFPIDIINAEVRSTGNLIALHTPSIINVEVFFTGEFILLNP